LLSILFSLRNLFASKIGRDTVPTIVFTDSFYFCILGEPRRIKLFPHFVFEIFIKWYPIKTSADPQYSIELWLRITDTFNRYKNWIFLCQEVIAVIVLKGKIKSYINWIFVQSFISQIYYLFFRLHFSGHVRQSRHLALLFCGRTFLFIHVFADARWRTLWQAER
jgi:hypothetical protein